MKPKSLLWESYIALPCVYCVTLEGTEDIDLVADAIWQHWRNNMRHGFIMGAGHWPLLFGEFTAKVLGLSMPIEEEADAIEDSEGEEWASRFLALVSWP